MRLVAPLLLCALLAASAGARADDLLGLYVGAGVGQSQLKQDYWQIDSHTTGWKLLAGWRPLSFVGAELDYADLGSKSVNYLGSFGFTQVSTKARATSLYAVGYLPVPAPWLSLYLKGGATRVTADTHGATTPEAVRSACHRAAQITSAQTQPAPSSPGARGASSSLVCRVSGSSTSA